MTLFFVTIVFVFCLSPSSSSGVAADYDYGYRILYDSKRLFVTSAKNGTTWVKDIPFPDEVHCATFVDTLSLASLRGNFPYFLFSCFKDTSISWLWAVSFDMPLKIIYIRQFYGWAVDVSESSAVNNKEFLMFQEPKTLVHLDINNGTSLRLSNFSSFCYSGGIDDVFPSSLALVWLDDDGVSIQAYDLNSYTFIKTPFSMYHTVTSGKVVDVSLSFADGNNYFSMGLYDAKSFMLLNSTPRVHISNISSPLGGCYFETNMGPSDNMAAVHVDCYEHFYAYYIVDLNRMEFINVFNDPDDAIDTLIIQDSFVVLSYTNGLISKRSLNNSTIFWQVKLDSAGYPFIFAQENVFLFSMIGAEAAIDLDTGSVIWRQNNSFDDGVLSTGNYGCGGKRFGDVISIDTDKKRRYC
eukprot:m.345902 g.345902  ORF g.345902 m.345902 type:complete len:410 (+) comp27549_c0_seq1:106-1335(+)